MRVSNTPRRHSRSRNNSGRRNNNSPNNPYDNNKDNKIKGNAIQVHEKYQSLARDAISSGDVVSDRFPFEKLDHHAFGFNMLSRKRRFQHKCTNHSFWKTLFFLL